MVTGKSAKRRIHTRYPGTLTVQVERDGVRCFALISQLSLGGAFIEMSPPPPMGTRLVIIVTRSGGRTLRLAALSRYAASESVAEVEVAGFGVQWKDLDEEARAFVRELVNRAQAALPLRDGAGQDDDSSS